MLYYLLRYTITPLARFLFSVRIMGRENLPKLAVLAANHSDNSDPVFLSMVTRRRIFFLAKHDVAEAVNKFIEWLVKSTGNVLIERGKGESQKAIDQAAELIKKGYYFGIFPEGSTINKNYTFYKKEGHTGVARIALQARVPVVPIAIIGNKGLFPHKAILPRFLSKSIVKIGKPLDFSEYYGRQNNKKITRKVTDIIMKEIRNLEKSEKT